MNYRLKQLLIDRVDERQLCIRHGWLIISKSMNYCKQLCHACVRQNGMNTIIRIDWLFKVMPKGYKLNKKSCFD